MNAGSEAQLAAIAELNVLAISLKTHVWLRGGWAVDFYLGRVTRQHADIDWFAPAGAAPALVEGLLDLGFARTGSAPIDQQVDLVRGSVEHGIAWVDVLRDGRVLVAGGPWAGEPWPPGMLTKARTVTLQGVSATIISPLAQVDIKQMTPVWQPHLVHRAKDEEDIRAIHRRFNTDQD